MTKFEHYKNGDLSAFKHEDYSTLMHGKDIPLKESDRVILDKAQISEFETVFESLKGEPKNLRVRNSKEFNIKALIKFKAENSRGDPKLFKKKINTNSGNIYLLIDGSGSMHGSRAKQVRNLTANIMKSIEEISRINLKAYVYAGDFDNCDNLCIQEISNVSDCQYITADGHKYGSTPTHNAINFIKEKHENDSGKKLLIVLTDGYPMIYHDHNILSSLRNQLNLETKRACVELEAKEFNLFGIGINAGNTKTFENNFRDNFVNVESNEYGSFSDNIKKHLVSKMSEFVGLIR